MSIKKFATTAFIAAGLLAAALSANASVVSIVGSWNGTRAVVGPPSPIVGTVYQESFVVTNQSGCTATSCAISGYFLWTTGPNSPPLCGNPPCESTFTGSITSTGAISAAVLQAAGQYSDIYTATLSLDGSACNDSAESLCGNFAPGAGAPPSDVNFGWWNVSASNAVPEPATLGLMGLGLLGAGFIRRRRKNG